MPIKFKCPNCQKLLNVRDHLAGKRAACPACKKPLVVPAPQAAPADLEEFAARALGDEQETAAGQAATIDFACPYCDEPLHLSADLGGKQAPCPECRRIIKVPMPATKDVADWRKPDALPSLARRDDNAPPEGAWESTARPRTVSREALEEADALVEEREPLPLGQKVRRGIYAVCAVAALGIGWLVLRNYWTKSLQDQALSRATALIEEKQPSIQPEWAGAAYRGMGQYELQAGRYEEAANRLKKARSLARTAAGDSADRDALLLEVALAQVDLAGGTTAKGEAEPLGWPEAANQWRQTLAMVDSPSARVAAARELSRKLIARGQFPLAADLVRWLRTSLNPTGPGGQNKDQTDISAQPVALLLAVQRPAQAAVLIPPAPPETKKKKKKPKPDLVTQLIHQENWARQHQLSAARHFFVNAEGHVRERLECLLTLAAAAFDQDQAPEADTCFEEALRLLPTLPKEEPGVSWLLWGWARLSARAGKVGSTKLFTDAIRNPALRAWVHLEQYRLQAAKAEHLADRSWSQAVPDKTALAHGLAFEVFTRFKAKQGAGSELLDAVSQAEPENVRPLGYVGLALGVQDRGTE